MPVVPLPAWATRVIHQGPRTQRAFAVEPNTMGALRREINADKKPPMYVELCFGEHNGQGWGVRMTRMAFLKKTDHVPDGVQVTWARNARTIYVRGLTNPYKP